MNFALSKNVLADTNQDACDGKGDRPGTFRGCSRGNSTSCIGKSPKTSSCTWRTRRRWRSSSTTSSLSHPYSFILYVPLIDPFLPLLDDEPHVAHEKHPFCICFSSPCPIKTPPRCPSCSSVRSMLLRQISTVLTVRLSTRTETPLKNHKKHINFVDDHIVAPDPVGVNLLVFLLGQLLLRLNDPFSYPIRPKTYQKAYKTPPNG